MTAEAEVLVSAKEVHKVYKVGEVTSHALRGVTLDVRAGDFLSIVGPSGSGKTTLLNLFGALDSPTDGELLVLHKDLAELGRRERKLESRTPLLWWLRRLLLPLYFYHQLPIYKLRAARSNLRLRSLGFVFQAYNLVPVLTARENVEFVLELQGVGAERFDRALEVLEELGLSEFADRRPLEMSGGQQQRVAVARAVASRPRIVLADEPTANLDGENAEVLMSMMRRLRDEHGMTFIFSTHDPRVIAHATRVVTLTDGRVSGDEPRKSA